MVQSWATVFAAADALSVAGRRLPSPQRGQQPRGTGFSCTRIKKRDSPLFLASNFEQLLQPQFVGFQAVKLVTTRSCTSETAAAVMVKPRVAFLGAGQMAEALARGFIAAHTVEPTDISAYDISSSRLKLFKEMGACAWSTPNEAVAAADLVVISVKPQVVEAVLRAVRPALEARHLLVSIAAGVSTASLEEWVGGGRPRVVRVMPNTPCLVGETAAAVSAGRHASLSDTEQVEALFAAVGRVHRVEERLLDAVTGLSGSGPAFVFVAIEALADGGVAAGLPRDVALSLAAQTVFGSAKMVLQTGQHPGQLKDAVASPGGTTIAGLHELEKSGFRAALMNAVVAASKRSKELSGV